MSYGPLIRRVAADHVRREEDVQDVVQDVFLDLISNHPSLAIKPANCSPSVYLHRLTSRTVTQTAARRQAFKAVKRTYAKRRQRHIEDFTADRKDQAVMLMMIMQKVLSRRVANAIALRFLYGLSVAETAAKMRVDPKTVSRYVSVGLPKLRAYLRKHHPATETATPPQRKNFSPVAP